MTRLKTEDIADIAGNLADYESWLVSRTGCTLQRLASRAAGVSESMLRDFSGGVRVGVTPVSWGEGFIPGFADAIKSIAAHLGFDAFVTSASDVAGVAEAFEKGVDVLVMADDERFVAMDLSARRVTDNGDATGWGFAEGLDLMAGGLKGRPVLVIGCGPVGLGAVSRLVHLGAEAHVYDIDPDRCHDLVRKIKKDTRAWIGTVTDPESALIRFECIIDASPAVDLIHERHITRDTFISAPGMPLSLSPAAVEKISNRLLHDPLRIGTAVMLAEAGAAAGKGRAMPG